MDTLLALSSLVIPMAAFAATAVDAPDRWRVYIGTYTGGISEGIYVAELDASTGALSEPQLAAAMENPSFLALHPTLPFIYAVGEGGTGGAIAAFRIAGDGTLTPAGSQSAMGNGPCHVAVSPSGKCAAVANYGSGSVALFPVAPDGALADASAVIQHKGSGPNPDRQKGPHAHAVYFGDDGRYLYVADLGIDTVMIYRVDEEAGTLEPHDPPHASLDPGAGPRHVAFHPSGRSAYVVNEMGNTVTAFSHDASNGSFTTLETLPTLPDDFQEQNTTAEIEVHPSGRFLYASNRGHDSIVAYAIDPDTRRLRLLGHTPTGGRTPRNFATTPDGRYLLAANQQSDSVVVFTVDVDSGHLEAIGGPVTVGAPVCIVYMPMP